MKLLTFPIAVLIAVTTSAVAMADSVYYSQPGANGIQSVSGTILQETASFLEIETVDGETVSIPMTSVFQIVRGDPASVPDTELTLARPRAARKYRLGIAGGMNFSNMSVDPVGLEEDDSLMSYAVGAWWGLPVNRRVTIQAAALYSVKGDSESDGGYTTSTRMSYIDVPVLAKIGFRHGSPARPSLFLGPSMAVNLSAKSSFEGAGTSTDVDVKEKVNALDLGVVVGGGVEFPIGTRTYGVDLRYSKGLSNVGGEGANGTAHNDVLAVMGSIAFQ